MQRKHLWKKLAYLLTSVWLVSGMLLPTAAFADDKGKNNTAAKPAVAQTTKQDDKKEEPKPASQTQTEVRSSNENAHKPVQYKPDDHPSGKDRNLEPGGSGTQGKSTSDPDAKSNGGTDKPDLASQRSAPWNQDKDNDGNNGCGNDDDFEDDNNGWCGKDKVKSTPTPTPTVAPTNNEKVRVHGCYVWNNDKDKPFYIDEPMSKEQAEQFERSTKRIGTTLDDCKTSNDTTEKPEVRFVEIDGCYRDTTTNVVKHYELTMTEEERDTWLKTHVKAPCGDVAGEVDKKIYVCHRTGSMTNPFVLIHVSVNAEGHLRDDSHDRHDLHPEDIVFGETEPNNWEEICKLPETKVETKTFPLSGCFYNPVSKEFVFFDHQTFGTQAEVDAKVHGLVSQNMNKADCKHQPAPTPTPPTVLGTTDGNPSNPVNMYGCFQKADGTYVHENRNFNNQAELEAYKASQGYIGVNASMPNPDQCKNPDKPGNPPSDNQPADAPGNPPVETAGVQVEQPGAARDSVAPLNVPALSIDRFITTAEAREEMPAPPAREGVQALISEVPAAPVAQAITPQQPAPAPQAAPRPTTSLLPTTGEPMVDLALLTLGFLGLTLLGLRFLRAGARRA